MQKNLIKCIFLLLFLSNAMQNFAQQVDIIANPSTSSTPALGTSNYVANEAIYTETEIGAANFITSATAINSIGLSVGTVGLNTTFTNINIYMKDVPLTTTTFTAGTYSTAGYTLVFSGTVVLAATGFTDIALTTPFTRAAGNNLQVLITRNDNITHPSYIYNCANGNNTSATINTTRRYNGVAALTTNPTLAVSVFRQAIRLEHKYNIDAAVTNIFTLGKMPLVFGNANHVVRARVQNKGFTTMSNIPVMLNVTGANAFSDIQTITTLNPGAEQIVNFTAFTPTNLGINSIKVHIPMDDFTGNDTSLWQQDITTNLFSYKNSNVSNQPGGIGFNGATGQFVAKYTLTTSGDINEIKVDFTTTGQPYEIGIWDANGIGGQPGLLLWTSQPSTPANPTLVTTPGTAFVPVNPPLTMPAGDFYVGVRQTGITNVGFAFQAENPIRTNTFYYATLNANTWTEFSTAVMPFRLSIAAQFLVPSTYTFPNIQLSTASINTSQSTTIYGTHFTPFQPAKIIINSPNNTTTTFYTTANSLGSFSHSWTAPANAATGFYSIAAHDSLKNYTTNPPRTLYINNTTQVSPNNFLSIQSPTAQSAYRTGELLSIQWSDKMTANQFTTPTSAYSSRQYNIEYAVNGGGWQTIYSSINGTGPLLQFETFNENFFPPVNGSYQIRISEVSNAGYQILSPVFTVLPAPGLGFVDSMLWDYSAPKPARRVEGVAADGTARIYFKITKKPTNSNTIASVSVELDDPLLSTPTTNLLGKLMIANDTDHYSLEANSANALLLNNNTPGKTNYWFWYVAPDDFRRGASDNYNGERIVKAYITVNYTNATSETDTQEIKIVRPPVMLVHGLGGDEGTWKEFRFTNGNQTEIRFKDATNLFLAGVQVNNMNKASHFTANAELLLNVNSGGNINSFQNCLDSAHYEGIVANRVDYICHSMGGSIIRTAINHYPNDYRPLLTSNASYKNYGNGFVNKLITLATPHNGSCGADFLVEILSKISNTTKRLIHLKYEKEEIARSLFHETASNVLSPNGNVLMKIYNYLPTAAVENLQFYNSDPNDGGVRFNTTHDTKSFVIAGKVANNQSEAIAYLDNYIKKDKLVSYLIKFALNEKISPKNNIGLHNYINTKMTTYNCTNFLENSDIVVPLESQLAGKNATTIGNKGYIFNGAEYMHTDIPEVLTVGNKVLELLNTNIGSSVFADSIDGNNSSGGIRYKPTQQTSDSTFEYFDTLKVKILTPVANSIKKVDSTLSVKIKVLDTVNLKKLLVTFQGEIFESIQKADTQIFVLQIKPAFIDSQFVLVSALYDSSGFDIYHHDFTKVVVQTDNQPLKIVVTPKTKFFNPDEEYMPLLNGFHNSYITDIIMSNPALTISVADTNVIRFDTVKHRFVAKDTGSTFAVFNYKNLKDTIYYFLSKANSSIVNPLSQPITYFTAKANKCEIKLNWNIVNQNNINRFELEESNDGKSFSRLAIISIRANQTYSFTDIDSEKEKKYYRLKIINHDGSYSYSPTVSVFTDCINPNQFTIFPNPTKDNVIIKFTASINQTYHLSLYDVQGRKISSKEIKTAQKENSVPYSLSGLATGIYYLKLMSANEVIGVQKVEKR